MNAADAFNRADLKAQGLSFHPASWFSAILGGMLTVYRNLVGPVCLQL